MWKGVCCKSYNTYEKLNPMHNVFQSASLLPRYSSSSFQALEYGTSHPHPPKDDDLHPKDTS